MSWNPTFKRPDFSAQAAARSPTPPTRYIEPLSPARPKPIEPNFNYPAINNNVDFTVRPETSYSATPRARERSGSHKNGHHRTPSTIDTLAEAALAISPSFQPHTAHNGVLHHAPVHAHPMPSGHGRSEPPHKRARSELLPSPLVAQYASRPATSYEQSNMWHRGPVQQPQPGDSYESRIEEASLLLNFRTGGFPQSNPHLPPPPAPSMAAPMPPRPHANSFPQDTYQPRQVELVHQAGLLPPFNPQTTDQPRPTLPSPQQTIEEVDSSPYRVQPTKQEDVVMQDHMHSLPLPKPDVHMQDVPQQTQTPPEETTSRAQSTDVVMSETSEPASKRQRGWPKGKPRGASSRKSLADKAATKRAAARKKTPDASRASRGTSEAVYSVWDGAKDINTNRRNSFSANTVTESQLDDSRQRAKSVPHDTPMIIRSTSPTKASRRTNKVTAETICAGCEVARETTKLNPELDEWVSCNGCKQWFHVDCAGFKKASEVRDVDKFFCKPCEPVHGKTTYVRKSTRAHAQVDYAELQRGVLKTSEESMEHHYIQPIKDGTFEFDPENFPRMRPELVTRDFFEKSNVFVEPICIPAEWNPRPWLHKRQKAAEGEGGQEKVDDIMTDMTAEEFEYDAVPDLGQDKLGMVMPEDLTVRQVCNLVGPEIPLDVIDVKTQNSGAKWTLGRWADYYEEDGDDKPIRNVISLEVSQSKLGRLLRRPQIVRDIDLQDEVWPQKETDLGKYPKVQFYCLMSVADSYTDFHIDFGGSSVYYHILKGKKTFFFIPPKAKHLKAYEEWNDSPQQNYTFLPSITKECYRVDLSEGDTMLIPSGWIHAVWTPETSLVIGGNFLNRMSYKNQFKVVDIEKANETPMKFRYPYFQKIMWYTAIQYLKKDPLPDSVSQLFYDGQRFERQMPIWAEFDAVDDPRPGAKNTRYYGQAEIEGLPDLVNFIFRTVMLVMGRIEGVSQDRMKRVNASIPKGHGEPLEVAKTFALWVAWKRGNEDPPAWAHPDAVLPNSKDLGPPKKLSARALKEMERKEAIAAWRVAPERQSARVKNAAAAASASTSVNGPVAAPERTSANGLHHQQPPPQQPSHAPTDPPAHHQMHAQTAPIVHPMAMAMNAMPAQYISTPKTSVLGPKRVACDACRKRRIRCKHKDIVLQATSGSPNQTHQMSPNSYQPSELLDNITVTQPKSRGSLDNITNPINGQQGANGHVMLNAALANGAPVANGQNQPLPGTNAYLNANIPMTMNGVPIFGEAQKRGRTKACFECRKSKRRCIHDDNGNVDPVKAAETPVPRGSVSTKKRPAEDGTPTQAKKKVNVGTPSNGGPSPSTFNQHAQSNGNHADPSTYDMHNGRPIQPYTPQPNIAPATQHRPPQSQQQAQTQTHAQQQNQQPHQHYQTQPPIDPNLFAYSDAPDNMTYAYSQPERPPLYQLPSLEQIANEVLDMNGRSYEDYQDPNFTTQDQQDSHTNGFVDFDQSGSASMSNGQTVNDSNRPDESVDSAISLPGSDVAEQGEKQPQESRAVDPSIHDQSDADTITVARPASQKGPHVNGNSTAHTSIEDAVSALQTSPAGQKGKVNELPLYRPPAPLSQSPEQTKRQPILANGESTKRKRDSMSETAEASEAKRPKVSGDLLEGSDAELARALQQDDMGLRHRSK
ncbi:hypothetical protein PRZ48_010969 [Zasmidium cellare]|uniref:JmjC domain-containing histone demethylation protein 1 n=1 Tax=Zasmidium cellare TaxID=395010 RepID=A0ABR0EAP5_ZASCE|nr:hypothetical protein PRZ48_010969 [Zasmidium cellare]